MSTLRSSYESILRNPGLPVGCRDSDVDGGEETPTELPEPTPEQIDQFCAEDVRDLFSDWWSDMSVRHHQEAFGRKVAEKWAKYAERHGIRKD